MNKLPLILLKLFLFSVISTMAILDANERTALITMYTSWGNPPLLTNWTTEDNHDPCLEQWYGISCDSTNSHVTTLALSGNLKVWTKLHGRVDPISDLRKLKFLTLDMNDFDCEIPSLCLDWNESPLLYVDLAENRFTGYLSAFEQCTKLKYLYINNNHIGAGVPQSIGFNDLDSLRDCGDLFQVRFSHNQLVGGIGSFFSNSLALQYVEMADNRLSGDLVYAQNPSMMYWLDIANNRFSGTLDTYGGLSFPRLNTFSASNNMDPVTGQKLHGSLAFIYKSDHLSTILIMNNSFSDDIMIRNLTEIMKSRYLTSLTADNNLLTGYLPEGFKSSITSLNLRNNPFWCPIGSEYTGYSIGATCTNVSLSSSNPPYAMTNTTKLNLATGAIGGKSIKCKFMFSGKESVVTQGSVLSYSSLECPIPSLEILKGYPYDGQLTIFSSQQETTRQFSQNSLPFYGYLPSTIEYTALKNLLDVWGSPKGLDSWKGNPPESLPCRDWTGLSCETWNGHVTGLELWGQRLSSIPLFLGDLSYLKTLRIETSQIHGFLNATIFTRLKDLETLSLSSNTYISGPIPESLGKLSRLKYLNLGGNRFSGDIPSESLALIDNLATLDLMYNSLSGGIEPLSGLPNIEKIVIDMNSLHGSLQPIVDGCSKLNQLHCTQNRLTGFVPSSLSKIDFMCRDNPFWCPIPEELKDKADCTEVNLLEIRPSSIDSAQSVGNITISVSSGAIDVQNGLVCEFTTDAGSKSYSNATAIDSRHLHCPMPYLKSPYWRVRVSIAWLDSRKNVLPVATSPNLYFEAFPCRQVADCSGNGQCLGFSECQCSKPWTGPKCTIKCSGHGKAIEDKCLCIRPWSGSLCEIPEDEQRAVTMQVVGMFFSVFSLVIGTIWLWFTWRKRAKEKGQTLLQTLRHDIERLERTRLAEIRMTRSNLQIIALLVIETIQLSAFQVSPDVPWWESVKLKEILPLFLLIIPSIYQILFWTSVGIVIIWSVMWINMILALKHNFINDLEKYLFPLIGNALFLPLVTAFTRSFICWYPSSEIAPFLVADESMQCWIGIHWVYIVIAFVMLSIFVPTALRSQRKWIQRERRDKDEARILFSPAFLEILAMTKCTQAIVFVVFAGKAIVSITISAFLLVCMIIFMAYHQCSNVLTAANYRMFSYCLALWSCICAAMAVFTHDINHFASIALIVGAVLLVGVFISRHGLLSKKTQNKAHEEPESEPESESGSEGSDRGLSYGLVTVVSDEFDREKTVPLIEGEGVFVTDVEEAEDQMNQ